MLVFKNTLNLLVTGLESYILFIADKTHFVRCVKKQRVWGQEGLILQTFHYKPLRIMFYCSLPFTCKCIQTQHLSCFNRALIEMVISAMASLRCVPRWHPAASPRYPQPLEAAQHRCSWSTSTANISPSSSKSLRETHCNHAKKENNLVPNQLRVFL